MIGLKALLSVGNVEETVDISGVEFKMRLLDAQGMYLAFETAHGNDEFAKTLDVQRRILARSIYAVGGKPTFVDRNAPTNEEVQSLYEELGTLNALICGRLYAAYDKMERKANNELEEAVKK